MIKTVLTAAMLLGLTACATAPQSNNYQAYLNTVQSIETAKAISDTRSDYDELLARCTTDQCVSSVASYKAIADITMHLGGGGRNGSLVAAPPREMTASDQMLAWAGVLIPGLTGIVNVTQSNQTQRHLSDNSAEVQISQNETYAEMLNGQSAAWAGVAGTAIATPSINVEGNYGDTNSAGNNLISGDGNTVGDRNGNTGRQDSDGPFDNSGDCREGDSNCPTGE